MKSNPPSKPSPLALRVSGSLRRCIRDYHSLLKAIVTVHDVSVQRAALAVDQALVLRNWMIGAYIVEFQQRGEDRAKYGANLIETLAADLARRNLKGISPTYLRLYREVYLAYPQMAQIVQPRSGKIQQTLSVESKDQSRLLPIRQTPSAELAHTQELDRGQMPQCVGLESKPVPAIQSRKTEVKAPKPLVAELLLKFSWSQFVELLRVDDPWKRAFYENECLRGNWSVRQLQRQIESLLYERTGLSTDKQKVIQRGRRQATEAPLTAADLIRDPYVLEFTGLAAQPAFTESDLETALLNHLQAFLLELGKGFCFEARQMRVTIGNTHDYIDLVFYHRVLRCHVLLDLKVRAFRHADAGQMNYYLNYFKANLTTKGDQPPVGIILCSDREKTKVEYAISGMSNRMFVSRYLVALPSADELQTLVERDRERFEAFQRQQRGLLTVRLRK